MEALSTRPAWFEQIWPRIAVATGVGYFATAYTVSRWLTRRSPAVLHVPTHLPGLGIDTLACQTRDGVTLKGWNIEPHGARSTVALFHGLRGNREKMLARIAFLSAAGYRCVAFAHRAHGEGAGRQ